MQRWWTEWIRRSAWNHYRQEIRFVVWWDFSGSICLQISLDHPILHFFWKLFLLKACSSTQIRKKPAMHQLTLLFRTYFFVELVFPYLLLWGPGASTAFQWSKSPSRVEKLAAYQWKLRRRHQCSQCTRENSAIRENTKSNRNHTNLKLFHIARGSCFHFLPGLPPSFPCFPTHPLTFRQDWCAGAKSSIVPASTAAGWCLRKIWWLHKLQ